MPTQAPQRAEPDESLISGSILVEPGRRTDRPWWHSVLVAAAATLLGMVALIGVGADDRGAVSLRVENGAPPSTAAPGSSSPVNAEADLALVGWQSSPRSSAAVDSAVGSSASSANASSSVTPTTRPADATAADSDGSIGAAPPTRSAGAPSPASASSTTPAASTPVVTTVGLPPTTTAPFAGTAPPTSRSTSTSTSVPGELVWEETFSALDTSRWALEHSTYGDGNNELQCYRPENVSVSAGVLRLRAVTETYTCPNGSTRSVTSGMVRSRGVTFEPGQALEFRVRLTPADPDDQGGLWPAVWSSGWAGGGWPQGGELDYLEVMTAKNPNRSVYSIHYATPGGGHGVTNKEVFSDEPFSASWHVVRFEYGRGGRLVWYLDGVRVHTVDAADTVQGYPAPFDQAVNEIKINLALGGRPGPLSPAAVGSSGAVFEVDYIRIYRL